MPRPCGSAPWCRSSVAPNDPRFCAPCRERIEEIKTRCFPQAPKYFNGITRQVERPVTNPENVARYVCDQAGPVSGDILRKVFGVSNATMAKATRVARERNWIAVKLGPSGGYCAGTERPPAVEAAKAA